jgi:ATP adenylyltransferase
MAVLRGHQDSFDYSNAVKECQRPERSRNELNTLLLLVSFKTMDFLFTPWRYAFVTSAHKASGCLFCDLPREQNDEKTLIVHRANHCYVILNAYPYTSGHVMIVPFQHTDQLQKLSTAAAAEMMELTRKLEGILRELYHPEGLNLGMNLGKAAGAGIAHHIHMHVLPRWVADANFISVIGETRILPEELGTTYKRIREKFV